MVEVASRTSSPPRSLGGLEFGRVETIDTDRGEIKVSLFSRAEQELTALRLAAVSDLEPGDTVVLGFVSDDLTHPVILGRLFDVLAARRDVLVNGRRVVLEADSELVLKCATATITIKRNGSISVRGERVISHAQSTNRIRGGSVEIN